MAKSKQERFPHILRPDILAASASSIQARNPNPLHSHTPILHSQFPQSTSLSRPQHSQPEPARLVFEGVQEPGGYPMPSGEMGNVVMQSPGATTDQYVVLIGNVSRCTLSLLIFTNAHSRYLLQSAMLLARENSGNYD